MVGREVVAGRGGGAGRRRRGGGGPGDPYGRRRRAPGRLGRAAGPGGGGSSAVSWPDRSESAGRPHGRGRCRPSLSLPARRKNVDPTRTGPAYRRTRGVRKTGDL